MMTGAVNSVLMKRIAVVAQKGGRFIWEGLKAIRVATAVG
jgi:hypothetical protein